MKCLRASTAGVLNQVKIRSLRTVCSKCVRGRGTHKGLLRHGHGQTQSVRGRRALPSHSILAGGSAPQPPAAADRLRSEQVCLGPLRAPRVNRPPGSPGKHSAEFLLFLSFLPTKQEGLAPLPPCTGFVAGTCKLPGEGTTKRDIAALGILGRTSLGRSSICKLTHLTLETVLGGGRAAASQHSSL